VPPSTLRYEYGGARDRKDIVLYRKKHSLKERGRSSSCGYIVNANCSSSLRATLIFSDLIFKSFIFIILSLRSADG
jgi:hypothetical protein